MAIVMASMPATRRATGARGKRSARSTPRGMNPRRFWSTSRSAGRYVSWDQRGNEWPTEKGFADYEESTPPSLPIVIPDVAPVEGSLIRMLGSEEDLSWRMDGNDLVIEELPDELPCNHAWSFKVKVK